MRKAIAMEIRDLISQLGRFDPHDTVAVEVASSRDIDLYGEDSILVHIASVEPENSAYGARAKLVIEP